MNRHAPTKRRKGNETNMNSEQTNTAATVAEQSATVAPERASSKKGASPKKGAPKGQKTAKGGKPKKQAKAASKTASKLAAKKESAAREGSKKATILELLRRKNGATLAEIAKATQWQNHSIRGFISGTLGKRMGLTVESTKTGAGERLYKISL
jgi:hypothetical protein